MRMLCEPTDGAAGPSREVRDFNVDVIIYCYVVRVDSDSD